MRILSCCPLGYYAGRSGTSYEYESFVISPRALGHEVHHFDYRSAAVVDCDAMNSFFVHTVKHGGYDLVMSMDPHWYSTLFGTAIPYPNATTSNSSPDAARQCAFHFPPFGTPFKRPGLWWSKIRILDRRRTSGPCSGGFHSGSGTTESLSPSS